MAASATTQTIISGEERLFAATAIRIARSAREPGFAIGRITWAAYESYFLKCPVGLDSATGVNLHERAVRTDRQP